MSKHALGFLCLSMFSFGKLHLTLKRLTAQNQNAVYNCNNFHPIHCVMTKYVSFNRFKMVVVWNL